MPGLEQLGMQLGQNIMQQANQGFQNQQAAGMALFNDKRQLGMNKELMKQQIAGSKELTDYNYQKQMQMFQDTGYGAQMDQLEKAGLNPALMYAKGGPGGSTNLATGQAQGQDAPKGGHEMIDMQGMGLQSQLQAAQITNLLSQAQLNKAQADKTAGVDTTKTETETASLTQGITNQKTINALNGVEKALKDLQLNINTVTYDDALNIIHNQAGNGYQALKAAKRENEIGDATKTDKETQIKENAILTGVQITLTRANTTNVNQDTKVKQEQIRQIAASITNMVATRYQRWDALGLDGQRVEIQRALKDFNTDDNARTTDQIMKMIGAAKGTVVSPIQSQSEHNGTNYSTSEIHTYKE